MRGHAGLRKSLSDVISMHKRKRRGTFIGRVTRLPFNKHMISFHSRLMALSSKKTCRSPSPKELRHPFAIVLCHTPFSWDWFSLTLCISLFPGVFPTLSRKLHDERNSTPQDQVVWVPVLDLSLTSWVTYASFLTSVGLTLAICEMGIKGAPSSLCCEG